MNRLQPWIVILFFTIFDLGSAAIAQQPNFFCYIQDSAGKVTDLSASVCGATTPQLAPSSKATGSAQDNRRVDESFWQTFSQLLTDPRAMQAAELVGQEETTALAREVCQSLAASQPLPNPKEQEQLTRYPASYFDAINTAAVKTYCPQYASKLK